MALSPAWMALWTTPFSWSLSLASSDFTFAMKPILEWHERGGYAPVIFLRALYSPLLSLSGIWLPGVYHCSAPYRAIGRILLQ